ncbi:hypothetical protein [Aquifex aeolicus]|nr:hypothetical protein [Aquifex aeolicus]
MRIFLLFLFFVLFTFGVEGYVIEEINGSTGLRIHKEIKRKVYITEDALITETEKEFMVQKIENGLPRIYRVIKSSKSYMDFSKMTPLFLVSLPFLDCKQRVCVVNRGAFRPTNEYKKIRGFKARKVVVESHALGKKTTLIQWYTKEWKELVEANRLEDKFYVNFIRAIMKEKNLSEANIPLKEIQNFLKEINEKFGGVVRTQQQMPLFNTYSEVISVKKTEIPDYIYKLPEGYTKIK